MVILGMLLFLFCFLCFFDMEVFGCSVLVEWRVDSESVVMTKWVFGVVLGGRRIMSFVRRVLV